MGNSRNCAHCVYSRATVLGEGIDTKIEWRCSKKNDELIFLDPVRHPSASLIPFPDCPVGLFKREG